METMSLFLHQLSGISAAAFGLSNKKIVVIWFYVTEAIADVFFGFIMLIYGH